MIRNLVIKELREHWLAFSVLALLSLLGLLLIVLVAAVTAEAGNALQPFQFFLIMFGILIAMITCSRLVVREYQGKTQLFLESLPLTRGRMIAVKYALGFAMMIGVAAIAFFAVLPIVAHRQGITLRFVEIVALRAGVFLFFVYSFFFVTGMLGRYRMAIYLAIVLGAVTLSTTTQLEFRDLAPVELVDHTFPFERVDFPIRALGWTFGLGAVFTALAFTLALMREGSAAAMLAEKMSHRETVFVTAVLIGILFAGSILEKRVPKQPFHLPNAVYRDGGRVNVSLSIGSQKTATAEALATKVHDELAALTEYLNLDRTPAVFIASRQDLDAKLYEVDKLENGEGLLVRANLSSSEFDDERFLTWLVREFLISGTNGRAKLESKMWVLDGLGPFWVARNGSHAKLISQKPLALRAVYGAVADSHTFGQDDLRHWLSFRERLGDGIAAGVAWSGLDLLARRQGPERTRDFLRAVIANRAPEDARSLWYEFRNSMESQLEKRAGIRLQQFMQEWRAELETAHAELSTELGELPRLQGEVSFKTLSPVSRAVSYRLNVRPASVVKASTSRLTLLHANLEGMDVEVAPNALSREEINFASETLHELPGTWSHGDRLYWTFSLEVPELGCEVISGWNRQEVN